MRTAVVRVNVDPDNALAPAQLTEGMAVLLERVGHLGGDVIIEGSRRRCLPVAARWSC